MLQILQILTIRKLPAADLSGVSANLKQDLARSREGHALHIKEVDKAADGRLFQATVVSFHGAELNAAIGGSASSSK